MLDTGLPEKAARPTPFLKWAGGKWQLLGQYARFFPDRYGAYQEPFLGGGAVFFHLLPQRARLSDINEELIHCYGIVRNRVEDLIGALQGYPNDRETYYRVRAARPEDLPPLERACRLIYLNKTCFNGLYRENSRGRFNTPFGYYRAPTICDPEGLRRASRALQGVELRVQPFTACVEQAEKGDFVYLDPPYHPLSATARFTAYTGKSFTEKDQEALREVVDALDRKGCAVMVSNSDTPLIRRLYRRYRIERVWAFRAISANGARRGPVSELVICNR